MKLLIENGADIDAVNVHNISALMTAISSGKYHVERQNWNVVGHTKNDEIYLQWILNFFAPFNTKI